MATTGLLNGTSLLVYSAGTAISATTSATITVNHDVRDATTKDSAGWEESLEGKRNWEISFEGMYAFDSTYGPDELDDLITNRSTVTVMFSTEVAGDTRYTGTAYLTSYEMTAGVEETATFSGTFKGTAALTVQTVT